MSAPLLVPAGAVVVLVAPSGSGKSTWARRWFPGSTIVSSDELRGVVGVDEHDQRASSDAFDLVDRVVAARARRGLTTILDSTGLQRDRRDAYRAAAEAAGRPCLAIVLDVPEKLARERNRARARAVPTKVLTSQWQQFAASRESLPDEGFTQVVVVDDLDRPVRVVGAEVADAAAHAGTDLDGRAGPVVHLHLGRFTLAGRDATGPARDELAAIARTAEEVGFAGIWVMDHLLQIPQVGREWDELPEAWTTLAWLAAVTERVRLGSLATPVTFRSIPVLAKAVATVDVLSGGRVTCGLGLGWFDKEHRDLGIPFPSVADRYDLLADHLEALPLLWGSGSPAFAGRTTSIPAATGYPRPVQDPLPLLVAGNGPRRTLALAAEHADAVNLQGDPDAIAAGIEALHGHLDRLDRDRDEVRVTARITALTRPTATALDRAVQELAPSGAPPLEWAATKGAGTVEDQVERLRGLGAIGVDEVMVSAAEATVEGIAQFAPVLSRLGG